MTDSNQASLNRELDPATSKSIEWFHVGQSRTVELNGVPVTVKLVGRKGRTARIRIEVPGGVRARGSD